MALWHLWWKTTIGVLACVPETLLRMNPQGDGVKAEDGCCRYGSSRHPSAPQVLSTAALTAPFIPFTFFIRSQVHTSTSGASQPSQTLNFNRAQVWCVSSPLGHFHHLFRNQLYFSAYPKTRPRWSCNSSLTVLRSSCGGNYWLQMFLILSP